MDLLNFLQLMLIVLAWSHADMIGIPPEVDVHKLSLDPNIPPVWQKKRPIAENRNKFIKEEVTHLLDIDSIREINYPDWLAKVVVVLKKNNKSRICVDYKNLNKACPKDSFPLTNIDQIIDAMARHKLMSFLDVYSRYNKSR